MKNLILTRDNLYPKKYNLEMSKVSIYDFYSKDFFYMEKFNRCENALFICSDGIKILKDRHYNVRKSDFIKDLEKKYKLKVINTIKL